MPAVVEAWCLVVEVEDLSTPKHVILTDVYAFWCLISAWRSTHHACVHSKQQQPREALQLCVV